MSVYKYLEAFAKLEKRLMEGQEGSAATRGQPNMHEVRNKLDKFIKLLRPREIQVYISIPVCTFILQLFFYSLRDSKIHPFLHRLSRLCSYKMFGLNSRTEPFPEVDPASTKSKRALCWPVWLMAQRWTDRWCFCSSLIQWCKNMKNQLCGIYKQCFLTDFGPGDNSQHLPTSLQERAQAMVQYVQI